MTFFFVVALELKRELVLGELRNLRVAAMPFAGALGGMIVPVSLYLALMTGQPGAWFGNRDGHRHGLCHRLPPPLRLPHPAQSAPASPLPAHLLPSWRAPCGLWDGGH